MTTVYKLTDQKGYTRRGEKNECLWYVGASRTAKGKGGLCTDGVIHAYSNPIIAAICNHEHANINNPRIFRGEMDVTHRDSWKKLGGKSLLIAEEISMPTQRQLAIFAILSVRKAFELLAQSPNSFFRKKTSRAELAREKLEEWENWADLYIAGKSTADAADAADAAARAAYAAAYAADAAAYAADAAVDAAYAACAACAADAADAAACAAYAAAYAGKIDFVSIAEEAMRLGE
jgi:hypothetical protein